MKSADKTPWIVRIIAACMLLQLWFSKSLWWSLDRSFPTIPAFSFLPVLNNYWVSELLPWVFVIVLLGALVFPSRKVILCFAIAVAGVLILLDVNRLQVWVYQWFCMLVVVVCLGSENKLKAWERQKAVLQFMLVALYFWSGLNKLNVSYISHSFPWLMEAFDRTEALGANTFLAIATAITELLIAIGFLFSKTRKLSFGLALVMHFCILLLLGPLGHAENEVIWPWNLAMMGLLYLLFFQEGFIGFKPLWKTSILAKIIIILWGIFPLGNTLELWDEQLSFKMYSGTNPEGILKDNSIAKNCFPDSLKVYYNRSLNEQSELILIDEWAFQEMNAPPYVTERTLKTIGRQWCNCLENSEMGSLEILKVWRWSGEGRPHKVFKCKELLSEN